MDQYAHLGKLSQSKKNPKVVSALKDALWLTVSEWGYQQAGTGIFLKGDSENATREKLWQNELINSENA